MSPHDGRPIDRDQSIRGEREGPSMVSGTSRPFAADPGVVPGRLPTDQVRAKGMGLHRMPCVVRLAYVPDLCPKPRSHRTIFRPEDIKLTGGARSSGSTTSSNRG